MVAQGGLREFHGGGAVGEGDRSHGSVADGRVVEGDQAARCNGAGVLDAQFHDGVVGMLPVDQRAGVGGFAGLNEQRVGLITDGYRFKRHHGAEHDASLADGARRPKHSSG